MFIETAVVFSQSCHAFKAVAYYSKSMMNKLSIEVMTDLTEPGKDYISILK